MKNPLEFEIEEPYKLSQSIFFTRCRSHSSMKTRLQVSLVARLSRSSSHAPNVLRNAAFHIWLSWHLILKVSQTWLERQFIENKNLERCYVFVVVNILRQILQL